MHMLPRKNPRTSVRGRRRNIGDRDEGEERRRDKDTLHASSAGHAFVEYPQILSVEASFTIGNNGPSSPLWDVLVCRVADLEVRNVNVVARCLSTAGVSSYIPR